MLSKTSEWLDLAHSAWCTVFKGNEAVTCEGHKQRAGNHCAGRARRRDRGSWTRPKRGVFVLV